jgi:hypothetical protein
MKSRKLVAQWECWYRRGYRKKDFKRWSLGLMRTRRAKRLTVIKRWSLGVMRTRRAKRRTDIKRHRNIKR